MTKLFTRKQLTETSVNLLKLAQYVEDNVSESQINMSNFRTEDDLSMTDFKSKTDCGTKGCMLGWAPFVEGLDAIATDMGCRGCINYGRYSLRVFPALDGGVEDTDWYKVFGTDLPNDKTFLIKGLRDMAVEIMGWKSKPVELDYTEATLFVGGAHVKVDETQLRCLVMMKGFKVKTCEYKPYRVSHVSPPE